MPPSKEHTPKFFCSICGTPTEPIDTSGETCECDNKNCPIDGIRLESDFFRVRELIENEKRLVRENKKMREALEKIESNGTNTFVDEKTNLWECTLDSSAQIAKEALESTQEKSNGDTK